MQISPCAVGLCWAHWGVNINNLHSKTVSFPFPQPQNSAFKSDTTNAVAVVKPRTDRSQTLRKQIENPFFKEPVKIALKII